MVFMHARQQPFLDQQLNLCTWGWGVVYELTFVSYHITNSPKRISSYHQTCTGAQRVFFEFLI